MQLGFVIDHGRCIGCHACTVACKAENDVPVGSFRTWVKHVETGTFPEVRRSFAVLRCNQCTRAPCVTICPVRALEKRPDGVVDVDPEACVGCKACLQACPYDALYIHPDQGTAQKCHFCVHRTERGLAPACAVVCPTEAIIPGDFHDPGSVVSRLRDAQDLVARKVEAGTGPNVLYREVTPAAVEPGRTSAAGGYLWADPVPGARLDADLFAALEARAEARTVYDVDHPIAWGSRVSLYLWTKSLAAGLVLAGLAAFVRQKGDLALRPTLLVALGFLVVTLALLVLDLRRPARVLKILLRPNWSSWLARGGVILGAHGLVLLLLLAGGDGLPPPGAAVAWALLGVAAVTSVLTAVYTAWLFGQARGRVLWMRRGLSAHLLVQAAVAGCAGLLLLREADHALAPSGAAPLLRSVLLVALLAHGALALLEPWLGPRARAEEYHRASRLVTRGPFAFRHWVPGMLGGVALPVLLLALGGPGVVPVACVLALVGLLVEEDVLVKAGQALPIS